MKNPNFGSPQKDNGHTKIPPNFVFALHECLRQNGHKDSLLRLHRLLSLLNDTARTSGEAIAERQAGQAIALVEAFMNRAMERDADVGKLIARVQILLYGQASISQEILHQDTEGGVEADAEQTPAGDRLVPKLVYLLGDNALLARDTALQLQCFGYQVIVVRNWEALCGLANKQPPGCVVIDSSTRSASGSSAIDTSLIRSKIDRRVPILQISLGSNFEARLAAARAGLDGYFTRPFDLVSLVDRLDALTAHTAALAYRVLIVGDEPARLDRYRAALVGAGMEVMLLHRPVDIFNTLSEYRPELILMDVDTPECTSADLTLLIRQEKMWLDIPIVLLSEDGNPNTRRDAVRSGADDVMERPTAEALIFSLAGRVERYRVMRSLILRDGLTGLYNHSATKEHLMREVARSKREGMPLALAMVDIDLFKSVNDTYGHPVGDQVIRAMARLLQHRLRNSDIVGRYGGEEFAVILPATTAEAGKQVIDKVREVFKEIRHKAEDGEFTVTFSAGIADLSNADDGANLIRIADAALYRAKKNGRNRIELARDGTGIITHA